MKIFHLSPKEFFVYTWKEVNVMEWRTTRRELIFSLFVFIKNNNFSASGRAIKCEKEREKFALQKNERRRISRGKFSIIYNLSVFITLPPDAQKKGKEESSFISWWITQITSTVFFIVAFHRPERQAMTSWNASLFVQLAAKLCRR